MDIVEKWNPYARIRQDMFGIIDLVALGDGRIIGIQATSGTNVSARVKKALSEPRLLEWLRSGGVFEVWGWRKLSKTKKWTLRTIRIEHNGHEYLTTES